MNQNVRSAKPAARPGGTTKRPGRPSHSARAARRARANPAPPENGPRYQDLFEMAPIGIYKTTPDGQVLAANPQLLAMLGYDSFEEFASRNLESDSVAISPPRRQFKQQVERAGEVKGLQSTWLKRDGTLLYVSENARAVRDRDGIVLYYEGTVEDVTEARRVEQALQRRNSELALLNRAIQSLNSSLDPDQVLVMILEAVRLLLQVDSCSVWLIDPSTEELICRESAGPNSERVRGWRLAPGQGLVGWAAQQGQSLVVPDAALDLRHFRGVEDQTQIALRSLLTVPLWVKDKVIGVLQVGAREPNRLGEFDLHSAEPLAVAAATAIENSRLYERAWKVIDERFRLEEELRHAKEAADEASRARGEFLSRMSHEIRTPIHAIIGMTQLALEAQPTPEQREYLEMAESSAQSLLEIIDDILDFSKIDAKQLTLDRSAFELRPVVERAADMIALRAHQKGLELVCRVSPAVPAMLVGDARHLQQVFVNLLGNAVKFTERGEIMVAVELEGESADGVELRCSVRDTGIGIPPAQQALIFDAFHQVDGSSSRRFGGTGLGLAISKQLVELMGGQIAVDSEPDSGSTFHFVLRLDRADAESGASRAGPAVSAGSRAWVVDDNAPNRQVLAETLAQWGVQVAEAASGTAAFKMLDPTLGERGANDLILLDRHMPEMDGFAVARELLARGVPSAILVMMLTTENLPNDAARCRELGIDRYLVKPIKRSELVRLVTPVGPAGPAGDSASRAPAQGQKLKILLAEDNAASQFIAKKGLERAGHAVELAETGTGVIEALKSGTFDVVLMDVEMPEMDGLEATRLIRQEEERTGRHQPILAVTAYAMKEDQERCLAAGVDGYLSKPVTPEKMLQAVQALQKHASGADADPGIDLNRALETAGGDRQLLRQAVDLFMAKDYPRQLEQLKEALARQDALAVKKAAHGLKGALDSFGSTSARDLALEMESMGRRGELEQAGPALAQLESRVREFADFFGRFN